MGVQILVSLGKLLRTHLKEHKRYDRGPEIHGKPRRVSLSVGEAQLAKCLYMGMWSKYKKGLKIWVDGLLAWDAGIQ